MPTSSKPAPARCRSTCTTPKERTLETSLRDYVKNHSPLIGRVTKRGKDIDLALVRLPELVSSYPTVQLGNSDELRIGQGCRRHRQPARPDLDVHQRHDQRHPQRRAADRDADQPWQLGRSAARYARPDGGREHLHPQRVAGSGFAIPANTVKEFVDKFSKLTEIEGPAAPSGPTLSKNPVPLASLSLSQDLDRLRNLNGRRGNKQAEQLVMRDLEAADLLRQRMVRGELTVAQMLPQMLEQAQTDGHAQPRRRRRWRGAAGLPAAARKDRRTPQTDLPSFSVRAPRRLAIR